MDIKIGQIYINHGSTNKRINSEIVEIIEIYCKCTRVEYKILHSPMNNWAGHLDNDLIELFKGNYILLPDNELTRLLFNNNL